MNRIYFGFLIAILLIIGVRAVASDKSQTLNSTYVIAASTQPATPSNRIGSDAFFGQSPEELRQTMTAPPPPPPAPTPNPQTQSSGAKTAHSPKTTGSAGSDSSTGNASNPDSSTGDSTSGASGASNNYSDQGNRSPTTSEQTTPSKPGSTGNSSQDYIRGY